MAKLFGIHRLELKPGVSTQDFERFLREEWRSWDIPGLRLYVAKADRHEHLGSYALVFEFEQAEVRDRYWPRPGPEMSEEGQRVFDRALAAPGQRQAWERWGTLVNDVAGTDWVVVAE
jgi:hypothetical protein